MKGIVCDRGHTVQQDRSELDREHNMLADSTASHQG
jgi:hypothetical protein